MNGNAFIFEFDNHLDTFALGTSGKVQQRMLVQEKLSADTVEAKIDGFGHKGDCNGTRWRCRSAHYIGGTALAAAGATLAT